MKTINQYKLALERAKEIDKLNCHILGIPKKIDLLEQGNEQTILDKLWVEYFLESTKINLNQM
jgi:hypothetical protein